MKSEQAVLSSLVGKEHAEALLRMFDMKLPSEEQKVAAVQQVLRYLTTTDDQVRKAVKYRIPPVSIQEFMYGRFYLDKEGEVFPAIMEDLIELNSGNYDEAVLTGGIGAGKTTIALYSQAYQLYLLSCLRNPHAVFGLDSSSEIKVVFQSINARLSKSVDYARFKDMIEKSPYFAKHFRFDPDIDSILKFPNRIEVEPVSGAETASIGQNVIGGIIDEVNFMAVVEKSKLATDGGTYDQAVQLYNSIARRRKSRFMKAGVMPGLLCLVSSSKTPGQFTDKKVEEARTNPRIFVYNKRVWDVKPWAYSGERFEVFIGDQFRKPRLLKEGEVVADEDRELVDSIPIEHLQDFKDDIVKALRDIAGRSTLAIHPYIQDRERMVACFGKVKNIFLRDTVDFVDTRPKVSKSFLNPDRKRFAHIDLGLTSDSAGLVIGHVSGFTGVKRADHVETLPKIVIDGVLEVRPPRSGEIQFELIRMVLYRLVDMGLKIKWVTLDSFQSVDTLQLLKQRGFVTGKQSMDISMHPYDVMKSALYDGRVEAPLHDKLIVELSSLERDFKRGKIDHPSKGSKDLSDALAGVVFGLTMRMESWTDFGINPNQAQSIKRVDIKEE